MVETQKRKHWCQDGLLVQSWLIIYIIKLRNASFKPTKGSVYSHLGGIFCSDKYLYVYIFCHSHKANVRIIGLIDGDDESVYPKQFSKTSYP